MEYQKEILENGVKVIFSPLRETKAVTILVLVPVGSRYENEKNNGLSHFIEHMMFKGTKKRPSTLAISKELDGVGASYNAFTGKEYTGYYIKINAEKLELGIDILSDILFNSLFDKEELEREKGVILEEIKMYRDNPLMYIGDLFEQTIYKGNSLARTIAGSEEVVKKVSQKKIINFKNRFYQPRYFVVSLAGNFSLNKTKKLLTFYFGKKKNHFSGRNKYQKFRIRPRKSPCLNIRKQETEQIQIALGFPAYSYFNPKIYPLNLLSIILGGNMSSRLFIQLREKRGLVYYIKAGTDSYADIGALVIQAGVSKNNLTKAIKVILEELKKIKSKGVSSQELQRAKEFIKGKLTLALEDSFSVAEWQGKQELLLGKILTPEEKLKKFFQVKKEEIKKVAQEIIRPSRLNIALIGSITDKKNLLRVLRV